MRGGSQAHLLRADDGNLYVTKFQNNPQHVRVLANEFLATRVARFLGLPVPDVDIIAVPDWLIEDSPSLRIEVASRLIRCASGLQLGIRYAADLWQDRISDHLPDPKFEYVKNKQDFWRIVVLDKWLGNCDGRQAVFTRRVNQREYDATFIDHGYCFNGPEWTFPDLPLHGVFHRNAIYRGVTGWESFEPALSKAESFDPQTLWQLASEIPPEWYQNDQLALGCLTKELQERRSRVRDLINAFRESSRNSFPHWKVRCQVASRPDLATPVGH
jgi:hypothetical protein